MDEVTITFARLRLPTFSIKQPEAFQVMASLPLPQPSTLIGALAYSLGVYEGIGTPARDRVARWVSEGKLLAARAKLAGKGYSMPFTVSPIVLRRFRIVDKAHERKKKGERSLIEELRLSIEQGAYPVVKHLIEVKGVDALYRDYVVGVDMLCLWAFRGMEVSNRLFHLIQRLGDTESLVSVTEVWSNRYSLREGKSADTEFPTPVDIVEGAHGDYILMRMCNERREIEPYIVPCKMSVHKAGRGKALTLTPSTVSLALKESHYLVDTEEGTVILPRQR